MIDCSLHKRLQSATGIMALQLDVQLERGGFMALYGPSGAGKTSTLKMLAGLLQPDGGHIIVDGKTWFDAAQKINLPPRQRRVGFVFQDYALFPNMTVEENLRYALQKGQDEGNIAHLIEAMELGDLRKLRPGILSGGQQQRVALARTLVQRPDFLLLDEPLAALDLRIRRNLQDYLLRAHRELGLTILMVSHDLGEIFRLADRVVVLKDGLVQRQGSPEEIFISSTQSQPVQFTAEVLKIENQGAECRLTLMMQEKTFTITRRMTEANGLQPGDRIALNMEDWQGEIRRLGN